MLADLAKTGLTQKHQAKHVRQHTLQENPFPITIQRMAVEWFSSMGAFTGVEQEIHITSGRSRKNRMQ